MNELQKDYMEQKAKEDAKAEAAEEARLKAVMDAERKKEAKKEKEKKAKEEAERKAEAGAMEILNKVKAEMAANKEQEAKENSSKDKAKADQKDKQSEEKANLEDEEDNIYEREPVGEASMPKKSPKFKKGAHKGGSSKPKEAAATDEKRAKEVPEKKPSGSGTEAESEEDFEKVTPAGKAASEREMKLQMQMEEYQDKYKRLLAEFENARAREAKESSRMYDVGAKSVLEKLLPIVDNFERAIQTIPEEDKERAFEQGVDKIYKQMMTVLEEIGVQPMNAEGTEFNPDMHNAVMHIEDDAYGENVVAEEMQKGYMYKDSVLRYSMVKVAN